MSNIFTTCSSERSHLGLGSVRVRVAIYLAAISRADIGEVIVRVARGVTGFWCLGDFWSIWRCRHSDVTVWLSFGWDFSV